MQTATEGVPLSLAGELTIFTVQDWHTKLQEHLAAAQALTLELADVSLIDGAGLQLLVAAARQAAAQSLPVQFVNPSPAVRELIDFYGLTNQLSGALVAAKESQ